jgi:hypothetical protein
MTDEELTEALAKAAATARLWPGAWEKMGQAERDSFRMQAEGQLHIVRQIEAAAKVRGYRAGLERAAEIADETNQAFLSPEYATGQPLSSFQERFACTQIAAAIREEVK